MLRQPPLECLFQFICSSNNHISRIHGMVERLCSAYGTPLERKGPASLCPTAQSGNQVGSGEVSLFRAEELIYTTGAREQATASMLDPIAFCKLATIAAEVKAWMLAAS